MMIIDTQALHMRGAESVSPELAANLLQDMKGITNLISLAIPDDMKHSSTIRAELLQAFGGMHDAEQLIRKSLPKE